MATTVYTNNQHYADIAAAIRNKNGLNTQYKPSEMANAINSLVVSGTNLNLQNKTVTPSESSQSITADNGYNGLGTVTVNAVSSTYVGSGITRKSSTDLTVSGATVSVPAGYYSTAASKSVATVSHPDPTVSVNSSTGLITASHVQGTGYVTGSTTTATSQLSTQAATTITPTTSAQTAVAAGKYTLGAVSVAAIQTETKTVTSNGTITPSAGKYLTSVTVNVPTGSTINNQDKTVDPDETLQSITFDSGFTGLGTVTVNAISSTYVGTGVSRQAAKTVTPTTSSQTAVAANKYTTGAVTVAAIQTETKTATPSTSTQNITPSSGKYLTNVTINPIPSNYIIPTGTYSITANGTGIDVTQYAAVDVAVPTGSTIRNQNKSVTPTESSQSITFDSGYTGLGTVTVDAISSTYVGSEIEARDETDLDVSGATVIVPEGYYAQAESVSVATTTHPAPTATINTSTGVVTATHAQTAGYVDADTKTGTLNLTTQAAKTVTPSSSSQTAVAANRYTTGAITVAAVPTETKSVTTNGTYTPSSGK